MPVEGLMRKKGENGKKGGLVNDGQERQRKTNTPIMIISNSSDNIDNNNNKYKGNQRGYNMPQY
jgi:hypothetical protein